MMAMLFSQRVILGKCEFEQVPKKLQKQVAGILIDECGMPELVPAEFGGTAEEAHDKHNGKGVKLCIPTTSTSRTTQR